MADWIRTDFRFEQPYALLVLSTRDGYLLDTKVRHAIEGLNGDPSQLATLVESFIPAIRPDLAGIICVGMSFDYLRQSWVFSCLHPSFERLPMASLPPEIRLADAPSQVAPDPTECSKERGHFRNPATNECYCHAIHYVSTNEVEKILLRRKGETDAQLDARKTTWGDVKVMGKELMSLFNDETPVEPDPVAQFFKAPPAE